MFAIAAWTNLAGVEAHDFFFLYECAVSPHGGVHFNHQVFGYWGNIEVVHAQTNTRIPSRKSYRLKDQL